MNKKTEDCDHVDYSENLTGATCNDCGLEIQIEDIVIEKYVQEFNHKILNEIELRAMLKEFLNEINE